MPKSKSRRKKKSKRSKGVSSGSSGGAMMRMRGGFKGVVSNLKGEQPKTKTGAVVSNIFWTALTVAAVALLAFRLYQRC